MLDFTYSTSSWIAKVSGITISPYVRTVESKHFQLGDLGFLLASVFLAMQSAMIFDDGGDSFKSRRLTINGPPKSTAQRDGTKAYGAGHWPRHLCMCQCWCLGLPDCAKSGFPGVAFLVICLLGYMVSFGFPRDFSRVLCCFSGAFGNLSLLKDF